MVGRALCFARPYAEHLTVYYWFLPEGQEPKKKKSGHEAFIG